MRSTKPDGVSQKNNVESKIRRRIAVTETNLESGISETPVSCSMDCAPSLDPSHGIPEASGLTFSNTGCGIPHSRASSSGGAVPSPRANDQNREGDDLGSLPFCPSNGSPRPDISSYFLAGPPSRSTCNTHHHPTHTSPSPMIGVSSEEYDNALDLTHPVAGYPTSNGGGPQPVVDSVSQDDEGPGVIPTDSTVQMVQQPNAGVSLDGATYDHGVPEEEGPGSGGREHQGANVMSTGESALVQGPLQTEGPVIRQLRGGGGGGSGGDGSGGCPPPTRVETGFRRVRRRVDWESLHDVVSMAVLYACICLDWALVMKLTISSPAPYWSWVTLLSVILGNNMVIALVLLFHNPSTPQLVIAFKSIFCEHHMSVREAFACCMGVPHVMDVLALLMGSMVILLGFAIMMGCLLCLAILIFFTVGLLDVSSAAAAVPAVRSRVRHSHLLFMEHYKAARGTIHALVESIPVIVIGFLLLNWSGTPSIGFGPSPWKTPPPAPASVENPPRPVGTGDYSLGFLTPPPPPPPPPLWYWGSWFDSPSSPPPPSPSTFTLLRRTPRRNPFGIPPQAGSSRSRFLLQKGIKIRARHQESNDGRDEVRVTRGIAAGGLRHHVEAPRSEFETKPAGEDPLIRGRFDIGGSVLRRLLGITDLVVRDPHGSGLPIGLIVASIVMAVLNVANRMVVLMKRALQRARMESDVWEARNLASRNNKRCGASALRKTLGTLGPFSSEEEEEEEDLIGASSEAENPQGGEEKEDGRAKGKVISSVEMTWVGISDMCAKSEECTERCRNNYNNSKTVLAANQHDSPLFRDAYQKGCVSLAGRGGIKLKLLAKASSEFFVLLRNHFLLKGGVPLNSTPVVPRHVLETMLRSSSRFVVDQGKLSMDLNQSEDVLWNLVPGWILPNEGGCLLLPHQVSDIAREGLNSCPDPAKVKSFFVVYNALRPDIAQILRASSSSSPGNDMVMANSAVNHGSGGGGGDMSRYSDTVVLKSREERRRRRRREQMLLAAYFGRSVPVLLTQGIGRFQNLQVLTISKCRLAGPLCSLEMRALLTSHPALRSVNITRASLDGHAVAALSQMLMRNPRIEHLDLSNCNLKSEFTERLAHGLRAGIASGVSNLLHLNLSSNAITSRGAAAVALCLAFSAAPSTHRLSTHRRHRHLDDPHAGVGMPDCKEGASKREKSSPSALTLLSASSSCEMARLGGSPPADLRADGRDRSTPGQTPARAFNDVTVEVNPMGGQLGGISRRRLKSGTPGGIAGCFPGRRMAGPPCAASDGDDVDDEDGGERSEGGRGGGDVDVSGLRRSPRSFSGSGDGPFTRKPNESLNKPSTMERDGIFSFDCNQSAGIALGLWGLAHLNLSFNCIGPKGVAALNRALTTGLDCAAMEEGEESGRARWGQAPSNGKGGAGKTEPGSHGIFVKRQGTAIPAAAAGQDTSPFQLGMVRRRRFGGLVVSHRDVGRDGAESLLKAMMAVAKAAEEEDVRLGITVRVLPCPLDDLRNDSRYHPGSLAACGNNMTTAARRDCSGNGGPFDSSTPPPFVPLSPASHHDIHPELTSFSPGAGSYHSEALFSQPLRPLVIHPPRGSATETLRTASQAASEELSRPLEEGRGHERTPTPPSRCESVDHIGMGGLTARHGRHGRSKSLSVAFLASAAKLSGSAGSSGEVEAVEGSRGSASACAAPRFAEAPDPRKKVADFGMRNPRRNFVDGSSSSSAGGALAIPHSPMNYDEGSRAFSLPQVRVVDDLRSSRSLAGQGAATGGASVASASAFPVTAGSSAQRPPKIPVTATFWLEHRNDPRSEFAHHPMMRSPLGGNRLDYNTHGDLTSDGGRRPWSAGGVVVLDDGNVGRRLARRHGKSHSLTSSDYDLKGVLGGQEEETPVAAPPGALPPRRALLSCSPHPLHAWEVVLPRTDIPSLAGTGAKHVHETHLHLRSVGALHFRSGFPGSFVLTPRLRHARGNSGVCTFESIAEDPSIPAPAPSLRNGGAGTAPSPHPQSVSLCSEGGIKFAGAVAAAAEYNMLDGGGEREQERGGISAHDPLRAKASGLSVTDGGTSSRVSTDGGTEIAQQVQPYFSGLLSVLNSTRLLGRSVVSGGGCDADSAISMRLEGSSLGEGTHTSGSTSLASPGAWSSRCPGIVPPWNGLGGWTELGEHHPALASGRLSPSEAFALANFGARDSRGSEGGEDNYHPFSCSGLTAMRGGERGDMAAGVLSLSQNPSPHSHSSHNRTAPRAENAWTASYAAVLRAGHQTSKLRIQRGSFGSGNVAASDSVSITAAATSPIHGPRGTGTGEGGHADGSDHKAWAILNSLMPVEGVPLSLVCLKDEDALVSEAWSQAALRLRRVEELTSDNVGHALSTPVSRGTTSGTPSQLSTAGVAPDPGEVIMIEVRRRLSCETTQQCSSGHETFPQCVASAFASSAGSLSSGGTAVGSSTVRTIEEEDGSATLVASWILPASEGVVGGAPRLVLACCADAVEAVCQAPSYVPCLSHLDVGGLGVGSLGLRILIEAMAALEAGAQTSMGRGGSNLWDRDSTSQNLSRSTLEDAEVVITLASTGVSQESTQDDVDVTRTDDPGNLAAPRRVNERSDGDSSLLSPDHATNDRTNLLGKLHGSRPDTYGAGVSSSILGYVPLVYLNLSYNGLGDNDLLLLLSLLKRDQPLQYLSFLDVSGNAFTEGVAKELTSQIISLSTALSQPASGVASSSDPSRPAVSSTISLDHGSLLRPAASVSPAVTAASTGMGAEASSVAAHGDGRESANANKAASAVSGCLDSLQRPRQLPTVRLVIYDVGVPWSLEDTVHCLMQAAALSLETGDGKSFVVEVSPGLDSEVWSAMLDVHGNHRGGGASAGGAYWSPLRPPALEAPASLGSIAGGSGDLGGGRPAGSSTMHRRNISLATSEGSEYDTGCGLCFDAPNTLMLKSCRHTMCTGCYAQLLKNAPEARASTAQTQPGGAAPSGAGSPTASPGFVRGIPGPSGSLLGRKQMTCPFCRGAVVGYEYRVSAALFSLASRR